MSRRPPPSGPDRTEQNRATLKALVKLESNKSCADCKRNKHPRWASWNIGVFVCIRCSGIHRGMGTHISRVKSVDLDSWTDEQMRSMLRWGNARANKYWEHKLAEGHVPNEAKIENFIRTKYDSRRWVMDGPMPDPATLDDGSQDDDVPLNVVREKAIGERERSASVRSGSGTVAPPPTRAVGQNVDLFGDDEMAAPARPSTTEPAVQNLAQKASVAPPRQTKPGESLLGLDFFGGAQSAPPARPSSTGPATPGVPGRADLKSSILSLYASKPAAAPQPPPQQQQPQSNMGAFAGMQSPPLTSPTQPAPPVNTPFGGMNDAFGSLSFTSAQQPAAKSSPFANLSSPAGHARQPSAPKSSLSGGSFFDMKPAAPAKPMSPPAQPIPAPRKESFGGDWGDLSTAAPTAPAPSTHKPLPMTTSNMGDLFDMSAPAPPAKPSAPSAPAPPKPPQPPPSSNYNAFNLSSQPPKPRPSSPPLPQASNFSNLNSIDAWGSNDAWSTPDPPSQPVPPPKPQIQTPSANTFKPAPAPAPMPAMQMQTPFDSGWGDVASPSASASNAKPGNVSAGGFSVQQDEEFGGWSHASPVATSAGGPNANSKPSGGFGGGGGSDDLFGNVWE